MMVSLKLCWLSRYKVQCLSKRGGKEWREMQEMSETEKNQSVKLGQIAQDT